MLYTRVSSGLDFLDASTGGIYANRCYLLRGPSLSGRSTAALQFLLSGITDGENALMLCSDQIENVILKAESGGIPIADHLMDNRLIIMEYPREIVAGQGSYATIVKLLGEIEEYIGYYRCSRLVFDTLIPLLTQTNEPHLINYIYSLMSSIDAFNTTTLVVIGEPGSPATYRITQLLEDSVVGSFSLSKNKTRDGQQSLFQVHKLVNPITPPTSYKVRFEYGVGIVQDLVTTKPSSAAEARPAAQALNDLPLNIALLDSDEETVAELEEIFHPETLINRYEDEVETLSHLKTIDCDLLLVNIAQPGINYKRILLKIREQYPKLPVFLFAADRNTRITYQQIKQNGGDALFFKPFIAKDLLGALEKSLKQLNILDDLFEKRAVKTRPDQLPEDFEPQYAPARINGDTALGLLTVPEFKDVIQRQVYRSDREDASFALVTFKMVYMGDMASSPHLPQGLELVKRVAEAVMNSLRGLNDRACRYMDKIVVLLENSDANGARAFANRVLAELRSALLKRMNLQVGRNINVLTAVSIYPQDANNAVDLLHSVTEVSRNFVKTIS
ncbi:MAG: response regulator [Calditrichaeota bacterium]|nr:response regulator [Calditrichota bacterium]